MLAIEVKGDRPHGILESPEVSAYSRGGGRRLASSYENVTGMETYLGIRAVSAGVGSQYL